MKTTESINEINLFMKRIIFATFPFIIPMITGCSIYIANLEQRPAGRFDGLDRSVIEKKLGSPLHDCCEVDGLMKCEYEYVYYDCEPKDNFAGKIDTSLDILEKDIKSLFLFEIFSTPYLLYQCRNKQKIVIHYDKDVEVFYDKFIPTDLSQERKSNLGKIKVKYETNLLSIPSFSGYKIEKITDTSELEAIKETEHWIYVKTINEKKGWIAKKWIQ